MRLTLTDAGPHAKALLDIPDDGVTEIAGPSGVGKSAMIDLQCWALWGTDRYGKALTDAVLKRGAKEATVTVAWKNGTEIGRTLKGKTITRTIRRAGESAPTLLGTDADLRAQLGKTLFGTDPEAARCILFPGVWQRLASAKLGGQALRDVLGRILPKGDLRAEVAALMAEAGQDYADHDPTDPKVAEDRRRAAKQVAATADGALTQARAALASIEADTVTAPTPGEVAEAKRTGVLVEAWGIYDAHATQYDSTVAARAKQVASRDAWRARQAAMGARPEYDPAAEESARQAVATAEKAATAERDAERARDAAAAEARRVADVEAARVEAEHVAARHAEELAAAKAAPKAPALFAPSTSPTLCPTCNLPVPR